MRLWARLLAIPFLVVRWRFWKGLWARWRGSDEEVADEDVSEELSRLEDQIAWIEIAERYRDVKGIERAASLKGKRWHKIKRRFVQ